MCIRDSLWPVILAALTALAARILCTTGAARMSYLASRTVKQVLRRRILEKLLRLGPGYDRQVASSEAVQVLSLIHIFLFHR